MDRIGKPSTCLGIVAIVHTQTSIKKAGPKGTGFSAYTAFLFT